MRIVSKTTLSKYAQDYAAAREALSAWYAMARAAEWKNRAHLERSATSVDHFVEGPRVVFKIKNNDFRLVVGIRYAEPPKIKGKLYIKFFGTHTEYDKIDAATVEP